MDLPGTKDVRALMERRGKSSVSIYIPTRRDAVGISGDQIQLKNALRDAEASLEARGVRSADAREMLAPARELLADSMFWRHQQAGLAVFAAPGFFEHRRLPRPVGPLTAVGERFVTRPLLPLLGAGHGFYVLLLQKSRVRLLEGTRFELKEIDLHGAPKRLAELLEATIEIAANLQYHSIGHGSEGGGQTTIIHSSGSPSGGPAQESKLRTLEYYGMIDDVLREYLRGGDAPMVLAGVERLIPLYRERNTYPHLADKDIQHGADHIDEKFLHEEAVKIVEPALARGRAERADAIKGGRGAGRVSEELSEIIDGAMIGRVETLFLATDNERWGRIGADGAETEIHERREEFDQDLLDVAAAETFLRGGEVIAVKESDMRGLGLEPPAAALFRY